MTNTEISTIRGDKTGLVNSHYVGLPSEIYDEYDTSYNSKKSKRFVFNKRIENAPKVEKFDIEGKTATQLLSLYNSLPLGKRGILLNQFSEDSKKLAEMYLASNDKEEFLKEVAKNTPQGSFIPIYKNLTPEEQGRFFIGVSNAAYGDLSSEENKQVNQVIAQTFNKIFAGFSKTDKKRFITNFSSTLTQLAQDTASLSEKEKAKLNQYIIEINKTSKNNPYFGGSFYDPEIGNIMMILIQAFNDNMNTEGLDQISQINDTKLINKFLQVAQSILQKNLTNEQNVVNNLDKKSGGWKFRTVVATIVVVAVLCIVLPEILPEVLPEVSEGAVGGNVAEGAQEAAEGAQEAAEGAQGVAEGAQEAAEGAQGVAEGAQEAAEGANQATTQATDTAAPKEAAKADEQAVNQMSKAESGPTDEAKKESWWEKFNRDKEVRIGKNFKFKTGTGLGRIVKWSTKAAIASVMAFIGMRMISPNCVPHGKENAPMSAKDSASLQTFQSVANFENNVVTQNNNTEQATSKRIGDDSEKISQASGFVQQAINMFGQAYSFRA